MKDVHTDIMDIREFLVEFVQPAIATQRAVRVMNATRRQDNVTASPEQRDETVLSVQPLVMSSSTVFAHVCVSIK